MTANTRRLSLLLLALTVACGDDPSLDSMILGPVSGEVTEAGGSASFTLALSRKPKGAFTLNIVSTDTTEGTVEPASLSFDADNWDKPQTVTVTGVDDAIDDGRVVFPIRMTADAPKDVGFHGRIWNLPFGCANDDTAGLDVTGPGPIVAGREGVLTIALESEPVADVDLSIAVSDDSALALSHAMVHFTPTKWSEPQEVRVIALERLDAAGEQTETITVRIASTTDDSYETIGPIEVAVTIRHD